MSDYQPVTVPLTKPTRDASDREQQVYFEWFVSAIPDRIGLLTRLVNATPEFAGWFPDKEPDSLHRLGAWLHAKAMRPELLKVEDSSLKRKLEILAYGVPYRMMPAVPVLTQSAAFDAGMYLGEVFRYKFANVDWWLCKSVDEAGRLFLDYGEPVLINFGRVQMLNPVRLVMSMISNYWFPQHIHPNLRLSWLSPPRLHELFEIWRKYIPIEDWR